MTCVPVPTVTPLATATRHTKPPTNLCWEVMRHLSSVASSAASLQECTKLGVSHTKDRNLQLHTDMLGCGPAAEVTSDPTAG